MVAFYNTGSRGWVSGSLGEVAYLGTWGPEPGQDRPSQLGGDGTGGSAPTGWPRYNRIAIQPAAYVGPGQVAWFQFTIRAPLTPGTYRLYLRPVIEGATWMEDYGVFWIVTVSDGSAPPPVPTPTPPPAAVSPLRVVGPALLNALGQPVQLRGVNRSGTEYACLQGWGIFDGPSDSASVRAIGAWRANAVRVPLNEDCWLGINGVSVAYGGAAYQQAIKNYVALLSASGLYAILELHWNAPGATPATGQQPMPDRDHSVTFWTQVAATFGSNNAVLFEPYNEPYPDGNSDTTAAWTCWRDGGTCSGVLFQAAGMQEIVAAIRATGATNVIVLGGPQYANALSQWLTYEPTDPLNNIAAAWHVYNFNLCNTINCWDATAGVVGRQVPIIATEIGDDACNASFMGALMVWLDTHGAGYLAWTWDTWGTACANIALISDYAGTPTVYGQIFKSHLATR